MYVYGQFSNDTWLSGVLAGLKSTAKAEGSIERVNGQVRYCG